MKRIGIGALALLALLIVVGLLRGPQLARAQDNTTFGTVTIKWNGQNGPDKPFCTLFKDSKVIRTGDLDTPFGLTWEKLPEGDYEVRLEAKGYEMRVKRIHVAAGQGTVLGSTLEKEMASLCLAEALLWGNSWLASLNWKPPSRS
jgi:hypothetical protein